MPTVLENYRIAVLAVLPDARLTTQRDIYGDLVYQIMDNDIELCGREMSPTIAWRIAYYQMTRGDPCAAL